MTGIITHLIRCVSSTPLILEHHVREAMALLDFKGSVDRRGMFFLGELEVGKEVCLRGLIQEQDDIHVLRSIGDVNPRATKPSFPDRTKGDYSIAEYPLGPNPTWKQVVNILEKTPWMFLKPWFWSDAWNLISVDASRLFVKFTSQMWLRLGSHWIATKNKPSPKTLKEAMTCWTLDAVHETITECIFKPCSGGLTGSVPGKRQKTFAQMVRTFFPDLDHTRHAKSAWADFWEAPGYIAEYHEYLSTHTDEQGEALLVELQAIFKNLQCLPTSAPCSAHGAVGATWKRDAEGGIRILTNPRFYSLRGIGKVSQTKKRGTAALEPRKDFFMSLWQSSGFDGLMANQKEYQKRCEAKRRNKARSAKSKASRKPPQRNKGPATNKPGARDADEEEEESLDEDSPDDKGSQTSSSLSVPTSPGSSFNLAPHSGSDEN